MTELCFNTMNNSAYFVADPNLPGQIDAAADAGFRLFGPDVFSVKAWLDSGHTLEQLATLIDKRGMRCGELAGAVYIVERASARQEAQRATQIAAVLQPAWVQVNVGGELQSAAYGAFEEVCDIIAASGARVALEYLPYLCVNSITTAKKLVDHVGYERAGVMVDSWHHFRGPDTYAELEALPLEAISYVQFDDALPMISSDLETETIQRRAMPGEGEFDLQGFSQRLRHKGYDGIVSIELLIENWRTRSIAEFARKAYETSRAFWP